MVSVSLAGLTQWGNLYSRLPGALGPSSSPRRGLGASFFVAHLGPWTRCGFPRGSSRGRAATPEADETRLDRRDGTLRTATLAKARRVP